MKDLFKASNRAFVLALREAGRSRNSYLWMGAIALIAGTAAAFLFDAIYGSAGAARAANLTFLVNMIFFLGFSVLARSGAWMPRGKTSFSSDEHLAFLKQLPLTARELVAGRMLTVVFSVMIVSTPLLFVPYVWSEGFRAQLSGPEYLLFAAFWVGYVLFLEGAGIFTELGLGGRAGFLIYLALLFVLGGLVGYAGGESLGVVAEVVDLTQRYGPLLALPVLLLGVLALALSGWFTARRLEKRELTS